MTKFNVVCLSTAMAILLSVSVANAQQWRPENARAPYFASPYELAPHTRAPYFASPYALAPHVTGEILPMTWYEKALADRDKNIF